MATLGATTPGPRYLEGTVRQSGDRAFVEPVIRPCEDADLPVIQAIYSHYVLHGTATFETEPPHLGDWQRKKGEVESVGLPFLVATIDDEVAGYSFCSRWRPRPAYRFTVEDSIYVAYDRIGHGIGSLLLPALLAECEERGVQQVIAVIAVDGVTPSLGLHRRFGFRDVGRLTAVGYKFDRWLDTVLMQKPLGSSAR